MRENNVIGTAPEDRRGFAKGILSGKSFCTQTHHTPCVYGREITSHVTLAKTGTRAASDGEAQHKYHARVCDVGFLCVCVVV